MNDAADSGRASRVDGSDVTGIILAGGRSSRFGRDKLAEPIDGEPLLWRPVRALAGVCRELIVVVSPEAPEPVVPPGLAAMVHFARDPERFGGPLVGLRAGLAAASRRWILVAAGDQPALRPDLLRSLLVELGPVAVGSQSRAAALVDPEGILRPLPCALDREPALAAADRLLDAGERRIRALLAALGVTAVAETTWRSVDLEATWTQDIDSPADLGLVREG